MIPGQRHALAGHPSVCKETEGIANHGQRSKTSVPSFKAWLCPQIGSENHDGVGNAQAESLLKPLPWNPSRLLPI